MDEERTVAEIAAVLGVARSTAHSWLRAAGMELRPSPSIRRDDFSDDQFRQLYVQERLSAPDIARRLGCGPRRSTTTSSNLASRRQVGRAPARPDRLELHQFHIEQGLSLRQIAARRGVTAPAVARWAPPLRHPRPGRQDSPVSGDRDAIVYVGHRQRLPVRSQRPRTRGPASLLDPRPLNGPATTTTSCSRSPNNPDLRRRERSQFLPTSRTRTGFCQLSFFVRREGATTDRQPTRTGTRSPVLARDR